MELIRLGPEIIMDFYIYAKADEVKLDGVRELMALKANFSMETKGTRNNDNSGVPWLYSNAFVHSIFLGEPQKMNFS